MPNKIASFQVEDLSWNGYFCPHCRSSKYRTQTSCHSRKELTCGLLNKSPVLSHLYFLPVKVESFSFSG